MTDEPIIPESAPTQAQQAVSIWHRLIPGAALTFHTVTEAVVDRIVGPADGCVSTTALWARTVAFLAAWAFGLSMMKWTDFSHGHIAMHAAINVTVVTSWLLAISQYPLACWAGHVGPGYDLSEQESHSIGLTRLSLVAVMEAATAMEISSFVNNAPSDRRLGGSQVTTRSSPHLSFLQQYLPPSVVTRIMKWYHDAWREHIPGVALTLQATLTAGIEAAYGSSPVCIGATAVWRTIAFSISWTIGSISMCSDGGTKKQSRRLLDIATRVALTAAWLLSVSEVPLQCWIPDSFVGVLRIILTVIVIVLAGLIERFSEEEGSTSQGTEYGSISNNPEVS